MFKKALMITSLLSLVACQSPAPFAFSPAPLQGASAPRLGAASAASNPRSNAGFYTPEDYRVFLTQKLFEALDQNKDKAVTAQEAQRLTNKAAVAQFAQMDINRNGALDINEFQKAKNIILSEAYSFQTLTQKLSDFFKTKDLNQDGFISGRDKEDDSMLNLIFDTDHDMRFNVTEFVNAVSSLLNLSDEKTQTFLQRHLS